MKRPTVRDKPVWIAALMSVAMGALMYTGCGATAPVDPDPEETKPIDPGPEIPVPPAPSAELEAAVRQAYERELGLRIPRPAIYNDPRSVDCRGEGQLTTTAYLGERELVYMYLSRDGATVTFKSDAVAFTSDGLVTLPPAGTFRVLTVLVDYPETTGGSLALWEATQTEINKHHAEFASSRGYASPIVVFENTNVVVEASQIRDPRSDGDVISAVESQKGISAQGFDIIISINIDPGESEGGFASGTFVYVGNYAGWQGPLTAGDMSQIAATAYHHEVGHIWGWTGTHDWAPSCGDTDLGFDPFSAPPILFGWEDVDGDGVPEILDPTPYGRSQR